MLTFLNYVHKDVKSIITDYEMHIFTTNSTNATLRHTRRSADL